jgi:hypothetical protein
MAIKSTAQYSMFFGLGHGLTRLLQFNRRRNPRFYQGARVRKLRLRAGYFGILGCLRTKDKSAERAQPRGSPTHFPDYSTIASGSTSDPSRPHPNRSSNVAGGGPRSRVQKSDRH